MIDKLRRSFAIVSTALLPFLAFSLQRTEQTPDIKTVVQGVDASVKNRLDRLAGYTVIEHYAVFRGQDEARPVAEMLVKTTYRKDSGKSYTTLSQSGSAIWRNEVLGTLLDNEKRMSQPGNMETALITSANYEMQLDKNSLQILDGRQCIVLDITPRRSSQYLFKGTLSVDASNYDIVRLKGTAAKSAVFFAGAAEVSRQYAEIDDLPMATHADAISRSALLGRTVVKIDYSNYAIDVVPAL
jgi:hypothetical protein